MTLNDKFDKATDGWIVADKCEEIADDYAIEFYLFMKTIETKIARGKRITDKQLLEIFKKEKGL